MERKIIKVYSTHQCHNNVRQTAIYTLIDLKQHIVLTLNGYISEKQDIVIALSILFRVDEDMKTNYKTLSCD
jgi:hypothetical protein